MGRSSRDQRGQFSTMVRYDGRGRIIPGSNILKKGQKPQEGRWQKKDAYECCSLTTSTTTVNPIAIGTFYSGGIIASSAIIEGQIMIVDLNDLGGIEWSSAPIVTGATGTALKTGEVNTSSIISAQGAGTYAASACRAGIIDWDLPSQDELNEVYVNLIAINAGISNNGGTLIADDFYWSSTEISATTAWLQQFYNGIQDSINKVGTPTVRAVRWVNI